MPPMQGPHACLLLWDRVTKSGIPIYSPWKPKAQHQKQGISLGPKFISLRPASGFMPQGVLKRQSLAWRRMSPIPMPHRSLGLLSLSRSPCKKEDGILGSLPGPLIVGNFHICRTPQRDLRLDRQLAEGLLL